jgi:hypothetical protein
MLHDVLAKNRGQCRCQVLGMNCRILADDEMDQEPAGTAFIKLWELVLGLKREDSAKLMPVGRFTREAVV